MGSPSSDRKVSIHASKKISIRSGSVGLPLRYPDQGTRVDVGQKGVPFRSHPTTPPFPSRILGGGIEAKGGRVERSPLGCPGFPSNCSFRPGLDRWEPSHGNRDRKGETTTWKGTSKRRIRFRCGAMAEDAWQSRTTRCEVRKDVAKDGRTCSASMEGRRGGEADRSDATQVCGSSEDEVTMLLCDACDGGFHLQVRAKPDQERDRRKKGRTNERKRLTRWNERRRSASD